LVGVVTQTPSQADQFLAELRQAEPETPPARAYATYKEMLADPEIDAIGLFTPASLHGAQTIAALEAGKHVLGAVPVGATVDECRQVVEAVARAGGLADGNTSRTRAGARPPLYMMAENWLYMPTMVRARQLYEAGALGRIFYAEAEYIHDLRTMWRDSEGRPTWRWHLPPLHYPTHGVGPYLHMTGDRFVEAVAVAASGETGGVPPPGGASTTVDDPPAPGVPWAEAALYRTASGAAFRLMNTFRNASPHLGHFLSFYGTRGTFETGRHQEARQVARYHLEGPNAEGWTREELPYGTTTSYRRPISGGHSAELALIVDDFVRAVVRGESSPLDVFSAVDMTLPGLCGHQAAVEGHPVPIPDPREWVQSGPRRESA
jgi:predicted dehydrogenase